MNMRIHGRIEWKPRKRGGTRFYDKPYGRLFPSLEPHDPPGTSDAAKEAHLIQLGGALPQPIDNRAGIPAAYTYLGQFIDHDVTFDAFSDFARSHRVRDLKNLRSPRLELDSLYGGGPLVRPDLYEWRGVRGAATSARGYFFRLGSAEYSQPLANHFEIDLPRALRLVARPRLGRVRAAESPSEPINPAESRRYWQDLRAQYTTVGSGLVLEHGTGLWRQAHQDALHWIGSTACVGDARNDENVLISQLTLAFMRFHNVVTADVLKELGKKNSPSSAMTAFHEASRRVRHHYQYLIVHDFLGKLLAPPMHDEYLRQIAGKRKRQLRFYLTERRPYVPIEFSVAAFRFGHPMVRHHYELNERRAAGATSALPIFNARPFPLFDFKSDLRGGRMLPDGWSVQWNMFLEFDAARFPTLHAPGALVQFANRIGPTLAPPLHRLPELPNGGPASLAARDLVKGWRFRLPSGERLATQMGFAPLSTGSTPLWLYILREAEAAGGSRLGDVGGTIVAETLLGLLLADDDSYLKEPNWKPTTYGRNGTFTLADLIYVSGAPIQESELPFAEPGSGKAPGRVLQERVRNPEVLGPDF